MAPDQSDQKRDEKQHEKEDEKRHEKSMDEKYRRDPLGTLSFAALVIWLGVFLLLQNLDVIRETDAGWAVFAWGGGAIIVGEVILRILVPKWRRSVTGSLVWAAVWIGAGLGLWFGSWSVIGPAVLIAIGVGILVGRLGRRQ